MSCTGRCFSIEPLKSDPIQMARDGEEQFHISASVRTRAPFAYTQLMPWQTRVLRLHSAAKCSAYGASTRGQLQADLLVVNLILRPGLVAVEGTNEMISYNALSYTWGYPKLSYTMICNGAAKKISLENATAMKALQQPNKAIFLWIDAICINQEDVQEKSAQVAQMLDIFQKAECVIAWLGDADRDSFLAFALFTHLRSSHAKGNWSRNWISSHTVTCQRKIKLVDMALLRFCHRPLFQRTWIRQEIYAAKRLFMQCGTHRVLWEDFIHAVNTMNVIASSPKTHPKRRPMPHTLMDAQSNATSPKRGNKPYRDLLQVLLSSRHFGVGDNRDTVYAVLGMCEVMTTARAVEASVTRQGTSLVQFPVDYSKSLGEVYNDTALYIVTRAGRELEDLAELWHWYKRSPKHLEGLASWAVDWRSGLLHNSDQSIIKYNMRIESGLKKSQVIDHTNALAPIPRSPVNRARDQVPVWKWPKPHALNQYVLVVRARVINYVAYLTNFTWELENFLSKEVFGWDGGGKHARFHPREYQLGLASQSIYARHRPRQNSYLLNELPSNVTTFEQGTHTWRLAILGIAHLQQLSLVPATTKKGDLVIAIGPGLLPMVVHPIQGNGTAGGLFAVKDPYEKVPCGESTSFEMDDRVAIALRRRAVLAHLDETIKNVGKNFEFHGPLFARTETNKFFTKHPSVSRWSFTRAVVSKRPHIEHDDIDRLFWETFRKDYWNTRGTSIRNRPIQELLLH